MQEKLWDIDQLIKNYPALKKWGVRWRVRMRTIPIVKIGRRVYFDPVEIAKWVDRNKIHIQNGGEE